MQTLTERLIAAQSPLLALPIHEVREIANEWRERMERAAARGEWNVVSLCKGYVETAESAFQLHVAAHCRGCGEQVTQPHVGLVSTLCNACVKAGRV